MALTYGCPKNKTEVYEASTRIGCGVDDYGNNQYMCIPNEKKSSLVEFCFNGVMGIEEKGNCLENSNGKIIRYNCSSFTSGCPNTTFYKYNVFEYPACLKINTQNNCYVMEPSCPSQEPNEGQSDDIIYVVAPATAVFMSLFIIVFFYYLKWKRIRESDKGRTPQTIRMKTHKQRIDKWHIKLLAGRENRTLSKDEGTINYSCSNCNSLEIGTLSISKKEGNEIHYKATATKDNYEVEIRFCASSELKKEDIILVNKLEGPAIYQFISTGEQKQEL